MQVFLQKQLYVISFHFCFVLLLAAICPGHNFPAKYVIHVNSPTWSQQNASQNLDKAIKNILTLADEKHLRTVAIPSVSSGK